MRAFHSSNVVSGGRTHHAHAEAISNDGEEDEQYDRFDPVGIPTYFSTNRAHRGASVAPVSRGQSVESTYSTGTTGHYITSSQPASPGYTGELVELPINMQSRLNNTLASGYSTPTQVSPKPAKLQRKSATPHAYKNPPVSDTKRGGRRSKLPSFKSLLRSLGESETLSPRQPEYHPTYGSQRSMPRVSSYQVSSQALVPADHLKRPHIYVANENLSYTSSRNATSQEATTPNSNISSQEPIKSRLGHKRHSSEPPPITYSGTVGPQRSLRLTYNETFALPKRLRRLPNAEKSYPSTAKTSDTYSAAYNPAITRSDTSRELAAPYLPPESGIAHLQPYRANGVHPTSFPEEPVYNNSLYEPRAEWLRSSLPLGTNEPKVRPLPQIPSYTSTGNEYYPKIRVGSSFYGGAQSQHPSSLPPSYAAGGQQLASYTSIQHGPPNVSLSPIVQYPSAWNSLGSVSSMKTTSRAMFPSTAPYSPHSPPSSMNYQPHSRHMAAEPITPNPRRRIIEASTSGAHSGEVSPSEGEELPMLRLTTMGVGGGRAKVHPPSRRSKERADTTHMFKSSSESSPSPRAMSPPPRPHSPLAFHAPEPALDEYPPSMRDRDKEYTAGPTKRIKHRTVSWGSPMEGGIVRKERKRRSTIWEAPRPRPSPPPPRLLPRSPMVSRVPRSYSPAGYGLEPFRVFSPTEDYGSAIPDRSALEESSSDISGEGMPPRTPETLFLELSEKDNDATNTDAAVSRRTRRITKRRPLPP